MKNMILSATAINNFKACPIRWRNAQLYRLRKIEETDSRRQGTTWHKLHEFTGDMNAITNYINKQYETIPEGKTKEDWEIERTILLYSMAGFNWYYGQKFEIIASEIEFKMPYGDAIIVGKIDQLVKDEYDNIYLREFKSTSKSLDDTYWDHLNLDTQVSLYILAVNWLMRNEKLAEYGISKNASLINKILYNVWHKPKIGPKFLTQKNSKELVKTGKYCDQEFKVNFKQEPPPDETEYIIINETQTITEQGKKEGTYAIYETPEMFGARLLQDIVERPEFYFQERELVRTPQEMQNFESELTAIYQMMKFQSDKKLWYACEKECQSRFRCEYMPLCYHNIEINLNENPPDGYEFRRIK